MHRSESVDWLLHYQAVLVNMAVLAVNEAATRKARNPVANGGAWQGGLFDVDGWRAAAIAAGAVPHD